jgi:hypothetical protein
VQYPRKNKRRPGQVCPDNMVVVWNEQIEAGGSYDVPLQPAPPFWVLEHVSRQSKRKDYEANFEHYEKSLKIRYYLIFYPDVQDLRLYEHNGKKYLETEANLYEQCGWQDGHVRRRVPRSAPDNFIVFGNEQRITRREKANDNASSGLGSATVFAGAKGQLELRNCAEIATIVLGG